MPRILVVDDEESIRKMLCKILERAGHDVRSAGNVETAIAMSKSAPFFDVVVSDVDMPGADGHELARWFAVSCPSSRVILMSGFDRGCDGCPYVDNCYRISKPFAPKEIVALVSSVLPKPVKTGWLDSRNQTD